MNQVQQISNNQIMEKNLADNVQNRVLELTNQGRLNLPKNYSVGNALSSAWLIIQDLKDKNNNPALQVCTKESIANALLEMAILGLNPVKKQGYFVVYGNRLGWFTSYFGKCASIKRLKGIETEPIGTIIYEGDNVEIGYNELGEEIVLSHKTTWENKLKNNRVGAYATVIANGIKRSALMTKAEIKESWTKNPSPNNKRDHIDFEGEFMKRTVINRLVKMILQTSNDDDLLAETIIKNEDEMYDMQNDYIETTANEVKEEIETKANTSEQLSFEEKSVEKEESKSIPNDQILHAFANEPTEKPIEEKKGKYF